LLENLLRNANAVPPTHQPAAVGSDDYDHANVMVVRSESGEIRPVKTPFDLGLRRQHILEGMSLAMGPLPDSDRRVPLDMQVVSEEAAEGYVRRRISFAAEPGDRVPAWLLIPDGPVTKGPAMLCLHQTTGIGKGEPAGLGGLENLHYAHELAKRGFVCLVPDYPSFGDYPYDFRTQGKHFDSGSMKAIWNNIRGVDLLESLPEVDPGRIGCVGHSLGGHNTLFTAAFDIRIRAVITSCGFTAFHDYYKGNLAGWTSDRYMPRIRDLYGNDPNRVPFDFHEVLAAIAPRSIFINAPVADSNFDNAGVREVVEEVTKAFEIHGEDRGSLIARYPDCGHDFPDEIRLEAWMWLAEQLK
jgi:dienelactone hydrolase